MRKAAFAGAVLLLSVTVAVVLLAGCGGSLGTARAYVKKGDETIASVEQDSKTLGALMDKTFADLYKEISAGKTPDPATFDSAARKMKSLADGMLAEAAEAKRQFANVVELEGIGDYRKYAELETKVIDADVEGFKDLETFLDATGKKLKSTPFDSLSFQVFVNQFSSTLLQLGEQTGSLQRQAENLKKQKKL